MLRTRTVATLLVSIGLLAASPSGARAQALVPGGLTALPVVTLGPNQIQNGGFETLSGGAPANWGTGGGWAMDQLTKHSGTYSYRWSSGAPSSDQPIVLKKGMYKLSGWIKTQNVGSGYSGIRLQMDFRPGGVGQWFTTDTIQGTTDWTLYEIKNIIVTQDTLNAAVRLENYAGATGTAWFDDIKLEEQLPQPVDAFMLYPNYRGMLFDDQPQTMRFDVTVTPPNNDFSRFNVKATLTDEGTGQVLLARSYPAAAHFVAELDGSLMQLGRPYQVALALVDLSSGAAVYTYPAYRVSKAAGTARQSMNVSFDAGNRVLIRGTPRFILGVYDSGLGYSTDPAFWENTLWSSTGDRRMAGLRINMYLNYWYGEAGADAMNALMANLQSHGVTYLQTGNCFSQYPAGMNFGINNSDAYVRTLGAQAGSAGFYTADECLSSLIPGVFDQYKRLRTLDPDGITFAALLGNPDVMLWRDAVDLISTDPYPMYGAEPAGGYNMKQVADWTALTRDSLKDARPYLTVLQFFKFTSQGRFPTLAEMRAHAYMAIVEGAKGLFWWSLGSGALQDVCAGWCAEKTGYMNNLKAVVNELADLEPVLLAADAAGALTGNSNAAAIRTRVKVVGGKGYLFAYNYTNQPVNATFTWNTAPGTVTVNAENRTLFPSGNSFTDSFGPYAAHVYVIANGGAGGTGGGTTPSPLTVAFANPAPGATLGGAVTVTIAATGGTAPYTYKVDVDGTNVYAGTNGSFSLNTTTLANGPHSLKATVTDSGSPARTGGATLTATVSNGAATPPPSAGGALTVSVTQPASGAVVSGTNWTVVWVSGASAGSNVYQLTVGGRQVATQTTASTGPVTLAWDTTKVPDGTQSLTASVTDASGKTGTRTLSINVNNAGTTAPPPTRALTLTLTPASGATVSGTTSVSMTAGGGSGSGYTYTLKLDGATVAGTSPYSWNTTTATNGPHTLAATVRDSTGATASATSTVTVANASPSPPSAGALRVSVTQPTSGAVVSGTNWTVVWVSGASAGSNVYQLTVGGRQVATQTTASTGPVTLAWDTTKVPDGTQSLTASVTDASGKSGTTTVRVNVSNTGAAPAPAPAPPPTGILKAIFTSPLNGATVGGGVPVNVWVEGQQGASNTFTLSVDGRIVGATTVSNTHGYFYWVSTGVTNGTHTLSVAVRDAAGRTGAGSVTVTVRN